MRTAVYSFLVCVCWSLIAAAEPDVVGVLVIPFVALLLAPYARRGGGAR